MSLGYIILMGLSGYCDCETIETIKYVCENSSVIRLGI